VSGTVVRRCRECRRRVLISDHGEVDTIGAARIVSVDGNGDLTVLCPCGETLVWQRERPMEVTSSTE
jgi:hypothetical protein